MDPGTGASVRTLVPLMIVSLRYANRIRGLMIGDHDSDSEGRERPPCNWQFLSRPPSWNDELLLKQRFPVRHEVILLLLRPNLGIVNAETLPLNFGRVGVDGRRHRRELRGQQLLGVR